MGNAHICPHRCHVCPDLKRAYEGGCAARGEEPETDRTNWVMPFCMGGAVYPDDWKARCTCYRGAAQNPIEALEARVAELESALANKTATT